MKSENSIEILVKQYEEEYKAFMGINDFPRYKLELFKLDLDNIDESGYGAPAQSKYRFDTGEHILRVCTDLELMKYVAFHEFTHILDSEMYVKGNVNAYAYLTGYTEYHASQVELMLLLGAKSVDEDFAFSVDEKIETITGEKSVRDFLYERHQLVVEMFEREDFPANFETLSSTLGALYNYFGLRSICKLYDDDFVENVNNSAILKMISAYTFYSVNSFMNGWFSKNKVELSFGLYSNVLVPLAKENKLL